MVDCAVELFRSAMAASRSSLSLSPAFLPLIPMSIARARGQVMTTRQEDIASDRRVPIPRLVEPTINGMRNVRIPPITQRANFKCDSVSKIDSLASSFQNDQFRSDMDAPGSRIDEMIREPYHADGLAWFSRRENRKRAGSLQLPVFCIVASGRQSVSTPKPQNLRPAF
jgi:hypothetical protein